MGRASRDSVQVLMGVHRRFCRPETESFCVTTNRVRPGRMAGERDGGVRYPGLARESADLLFMLMVLWAEMGITPEDIYAELSAREGTSGLDAKRARNKKSA